MFSSCYNNYVKIFSKTFEGAKPELVLKTVFGYDSFRLNQKEIITKVLEGTDTLAIMPTGGGKSICYQIPALIMEGITVVVSPLISLMQNQVDALEASGIHSVFLNSTLEWKDYLAAVDDIKAGKVKLVYVSPEGLATSRIRELFSQSGIKISCITIDEAHCISQWGHDFRPDYLEISAMRNYFPEATMLALTATATDLVRKDIIRILRLKKPAVFVSSFNRSNIYLEVQPKRKADSQVVEYIRHHSGDSGIIYCYSRKKVDELTATLDKLGYSALSYHAGLTDEVRAKNQDLFIKDEVQIMVATIAFGMGIDKPNVRFVINYDLPKSIEEYYQEIGRAGRDGLPSSALLLYSPADIFKIRYFFEEAANPEKSEKLLQEMVNYATSRVCRRKTLLAYFGEVYDKDSPVKQGNDTISKQGNDTVECCCDICSGGTIPLTDVTIPAQKFFCCMIKTNERFGATYVIDVLLGSKQKRIIENGHNHISTWGIGNELTKNEWFDLLELLVSEDYIIKEGEYNVLKLTYKAKTALRNRTPIMLPIRIAETQFDSAGIPQSESQKAPQYIIHKKNEKIIAEKPSEQDAEGERIVTELKAWRKRKAEDMNMPPYIIFNDKTLFDIAAKKPKSKTDLQNVYGIGQAKIEQFGTTILRIVAGE